LSSVLDLKTCQKAPEIIRTDTARFQFHASRHKRRKGFKKIYHLYLHPIYFSVPLIRNFLAEGGPQSLEGGGNLGSKTSSPLEPSE
jgi:hypothetical protein